MRPEERFLGEGLVNSNGRAADEERADSRSLTGLSAFVRGSRWEVASPL